MRYTCGPLQREWVFVRLRLMWVGTWLHCIEGIYVSVLLNSQKVRGCKNLSLGSEVDLSFLFKMSKDHKKMEEGNKASSLYILHTINIPSTWSVLNIK